MTGALVISSNVDHWDVVTFFYVMMIDALENMAKFVAMYSYWLD